jgi:hypothetical protein
MGKETSMMVYFENIAGPAPPPLAPLQTKNKYSELRNC